MAFSPAARGQKYVFLNAGFIRIKIDQKRSAATFGAISGRRGGKGMMSAKSLKLNEYSIGVAYKQ